MTRRLFAFMLAFLMLFSSVPVETFATTDSGETVTEATETTSAVETEEQASEAETEEQASEAETEEQTSEPATEEQTSEPATEEQVSEPATEEQASEPATEEQASEPATEEQSTEPATEAAPTFHFGWEYAAITLTGDGVIKHALADVTENHLGSQVTVTVDGVPLSEGSLLMGAVNAETTSSVTVTAAEGYTISNVVVANYHGSALTGELVFTESAYGFVVDADSVSERSVTIALSELYSYLYDTDGANNYLMVELAGTGEDNDTPDAAVLAPPGMGGGSSYGSDLGWEYAIIQASYSSSGAFSGYTLTDPTGSNHLGSHLNVTINGNAVSEYNSSTSNMVTSALSATATGTVTISVKPGSPYYIAEMILACGNNDSTPNPFKCNTKSTSDAYTFPISGTPTSVTANLSDVYAVANHGSRDDDYFIVIELAPLPAPVYVGYDSGTAGTHDVAARPVVETGNIAYTASGTAYEATPVTSGSTVYPTWSYPTAASTHYALGISPEAEAEANQYGYSFAGWHLEYYTVYTPNTFSGEMTVGGSNLKKGTAVTLTVHAKLTAIWQPMIQLEVSKVWSPAVNYPEAVNINVLKNGVDSGIDILLNAANNWHAVINVPSKDENGNTITYSVSEDVPNSYTESIAVVTPSSSEYEYAFQVTNTLTGIHVEAAKIWADDHDRDNIRPDSVTVKLLANGVDTGLTAVLNEANYWAAAWSDMPKYNSDGTEVEYTIQEVNVPEGYTATYSVDEHTGTLVVTNTHVPEKTAVAVTKVWDDANNQDDKRPASITVNLYQNGEVYGTAELNAAGGWSHTFTDLPKNEAGVAINYTVAEVVPDGYTANVTGSASEGYTITNTHTPETVSVLVVKHWEDENDQDGKRPAEVTVTLYADGVEVASYTLKADENWKHTFADLPKYAPKTDPSADSVEIVYTVDEKAVPEGYTKTVNGYTITNTHEPEVAQLNVEKIWDDFNNNDGKRPYAVVVTLHKNGQPMADKALTLSASNGWKGTWADMPRYEDGERISYSIVETGYYMTEGGALVEGVPAGYSVTHSYDAAGTSNPTAYLTNTYTPELTALDVQKSWDDDHNREGKRPESVTVTLWRKVGENGTLEAVKDSNGNPVTVVLNDANEWDASFEGLPKYSGGELIHYEVVEAQVEGYDAPTYELNEKTNVVVITNHRTVNRNVSISVTKVWDDANNQDGIRPDSVTVTLYANGIDTEVTQVLNAENNWTASWTGLYDYYKGEKILYTVEEVAVAEGYTLLTPTVETIGDSTHYTLTNKHTPETVSVPVAKMWEDNYNQDGIRPSEIIVTLMADGIQVDEAALKADGYWKHTFTNLPKYAEKTDPSDASVEIVYTVTEDAVLGYTSVMSGNAASGYTITNTHETEKTSVTVTKLWEDANDQDGKRPASIQVVLYANGVAKETATVTADTDGNWHHTFANLDKYAGGVEIKYTVDEANVSEYYTKTVDGYTITNTHVPEKTSVTVSKKWEDANNQDGMRPDTITLHIWKNGVKLDAKSVTIDATNGWTHTFTDLDVYAGGAKIEYTVTEDAVAEYTTGITGTAAEGYTITNTHEIEKTSVTVSKVWEDANNQDGKRPDTITLYLWADGIKLDDKTLTVNAPDGWSYTYTDLDKYADGKQIVYTVTEEAVDAYTTKITGSAASGYTVTNSHVPAKISVPVSKEWSDANDQDGMRPESVTVRLHKTVDGVTTEAAFVVLNAGNYWKYTFADLPQYEDGKLIAYHLTEDPVTGYTADIDQTTGKIVNTHTPETVTIVVNKEWAGDENATDARPDTITLHLLANGKHLFENNPQVVSVNADGTWSHTWTTGPDGKHLPKYADGQLINYTVTENHVQNKEGIDYFATYNVVRDDNKNTINVTVTNTLTQDYTAVTVEKIWNDTYNQDGLRPVSVFVELYEAYKDGDAYTAPKSSGKSYLELSASNGWMGSFANLPTHHSGAEIRYSVQEVGYKLTSTSEVEYRNASDFAVPGYVVDYDVDEKTGDLEVINTRAVKTMDVSVVKIWDDQNNQDGVRPDSVKVTLYINGVASTDPDHTVVLSGDKWEHTWENLPVHHGIAVNNVYTVVEEAVENYDTNIALTKEVKDTDDDLTALEYTITNTHTPEMTSVTVNKVWDDAENQDGKRPASVTVQLLADGKQVNTAVLNAENNWTCTWTNLYKYAEGAEGVEIRYTVDEANVPEGYTKTVDGYTITNTHIPEKISVIATKEWKDENNQDGKRPETITLHLLANGHHTEQKKVLSADTEWKAEWTGLDKYAGGVEINYTIKEEAIPGYSTTYDGYKITNSYTPEKVAVNVWKEWNDANNQDGLRPDSVTVKLLADGEQVGETKLEAANNWMDGFENLPKYQNGKEITYTVVEDPVAGYTTQITGSATDGYTITNTHVPEKTSVMVSKVWEDANDQDGKRLAEITVNLHKDGVIFQTATLKADNWSYTFADLDKYANGKEILYTVSEVVPAGYTAQVAGTAASGYTITNIHELEKTSVTVFKKWEDVNDQDGMRPESITVALLVNEEQVNTAVLNAQNNWTYTWTTDAEGNDLLKYAPKTDPSAKEAEIAYTVDELAVPKGYTKTVNGYTITNTHVPEVAQLNVQKVWKDFDNNDGKRPYAVVVTLYKNGQPMTDKSLILSASNSWKGTWADMPRYEDGERISYSIVETGYYMTEGGALVEGVPAGYSVTHSYDAAGTSNPTAQVINSYTPEMVSLDVQKSWDDDHNREGKRPESVTVTLWRKVGENGELKPVYDSNNQQVTAVLNEANEWDATFEGLPKYSGGKLIHYEVVEAQVEGYDAPTYKLDEKTNVVIITNHRTVNRNVSISVTKAWEDANNQDGIRPDSITVTLYANGIDTKVTRVLNAENNWTASWTGLYDYYKGQKIRYTVEEIDVADGYTVELSGNAAGGFVITNKHTPDTISVTVSKEWDDKHNQDGKRPDAITIALLADGNKMDEVTLNAGNYWKHTFEGLPKHAVKTDPSATTKEIQYTVVETGMAKDNASLDMNTYGYKPSYEGDMVKGLKVINSYTPEQTELTAEKVWADEDDQDGKRPDSITVHLLADGTHLGEAYKRVLSEETEWTATWDNLDKYSAGKLIHYTVYEEPIVFAVAEAEDGIAPQAAEGYTVSYNRVSDTKVIITNTYVPETTVCTVSKVWDDDIDRDGLRPDEIKVALFADGQDTGAHQTLVATNGWSASWTDLPVYKDHGTPIVYEVKEITVPSDYEAKITRDGNVFTLTNTHAPATTDISVKKVWADEEDNDGKRPDGIIVQLYADGSEVKDARVILDASNEWKHTFTSTEEKPLYVFNQGEQIRYYVSEVGYVIDDVEYEGLPEGYVNDTTVGTNGYDISITNTHVTQKISLSVTKAWDDNNNQDGLRPESVEVTLLKNGAKVETVTLNEANAWTYTWTNLHKYAGGVEAVYTVEEAAVKDYTVAYSYDTSVADCITATVTNTHVPAVKTCTVKKVWDDKNDAEKLRPTSVTVQIYKNGNAYGDKIVLTAANNWTASVELPVYENGTQIVWTIKELSIPRYYAASYNQETLTVTNTIQSKEIPKTGDDNHLWLWVGLLGLCSGSAVSVLYFDKKKRAKR